MKRLPIWLTCLLLVFGQQQVLQAEDFNPDLPPEPMTKYAVSVSADPAEGATSLFGAGTYATGTTITVSQTTREGYTFQNWTLDGANYSTEPSFSYKVENASVSFVAHYTKIVITPVDVLVSVDNAAAGTVSGAGSYNPGTSVLISATPNTDAGYSFSHWTKNGIEVSNPASFTYIVEASSVEFKAFFTYTEFDPETPHEPATKQPVYLAADPVSGAELYGAGIYSRGTTVDISVSPKPNYRFNHWTLNGTKTDYSASFTYTIGDEPAYFVAHLDYLQTVSVSANPSGAGWTYGSGYYDIGEKVNISAEANSPYEFAYYTINGYMMDVEQSFVYTVGDSSVYIVANFRNPATEFNPETPPEPIVYVSISATPPENYYFVSWNDGNTDNPRMVPANKVDDYTPIFAPVDFEITDYATICSNEFYMLGTNRLTVSGVYQATLVSSLGSDSIVNLQLTVNPAYFFSTTETFYGDEEISVEFFDEIVTKPGTYLKEFTTKLGCDSIYQLQVVLIGETKPVIYTITANVNDPVMGTVTGGGDYEEGATATLKAEANEGYRFVQWSDGNKDNPRSFTVMENATYTAQFEKIPDDPEPPQPTYFTLTVDIDPAGKGTVFFDGNTVKSNSLSVKEGTTVTLTVEPEDGYEFMYFLDNKQRITDDTYAVTMTADKTITAYFEEIQESIDEISNDKMRKCENVKILRDGRLFILCDGVMYNAQGARVE